MGLHFAALLALVFFALVASGSFRRGPHVVHNAIPEATWLDSGRPSVANCSERFFEQKLDHFGYNRPPTGPNATVGYSFKQRYFVCLEHNWKPNGTIFYYTGNECNVELFVNMTGLMWQNADKFGAVLIFAEHRFFGKSLPYPGEDMPHPSKLTHLTTDQALADYATHINWLRSSTNSPASPVIGFGGSYGGMLCSWLRIKYPMALDGCIAGSAPIVNFEHMDPPYNSDAFSAVETFDATAKGGSVPGCADNMRKAWQDIVSVAEAGNADKLTSIFQTCQPIKTVTDAKNLRDYLASAWPNMAMSSYPYPSSYLLLGGRGVLPAYPLRLACTHIGGNYSTSEDRLAALFKAALVYYNATSDFKCLDLSGDVNHATAVVDYLWNYLACTTMFMPSSQNGVTDMFWPEPWNQTQQIETCQSMYGGTTPQPDWVQIQYGGWGVSHWGSNIVFSNGGLDPWRPGGITNSTTDKVKTVIIPDMGHHIDLFFDNPNDTEAIRETRKMEVRHIAKWIKEKHTTF